MKIHWLSVVVLLWLGWYISGPVAETFDFWDTPRLEIRDIANNADGGIALVAAIFGVVVWVISR